MYGQVCKKSNDDLAGIVQIGYLREYSKTFLSDIIPVMSRFIFEETMFLMSYDRISTELLVVPFTPQQD